MGAFIGPAAEALCKTHCVFPSPEVTVGGNVPTAGLLALTHSVEKPLATNVDDGRKMVEAWRAQDKILMIGYHGRFQPNYQRARKSILRGRAGHTYLVQDCLLSGSPLLTWGKSRWFYRRGVGGVLLDLGGHD